MKKVVLTLRLEPHEYQEIEKVLKLLRKKQVQKFGKFAPEVSRNKILSYCLALGIDRWRKTAAIFK